ncbi:hypothetical protein [Brenneria alni]|uniref:hypothetical protein n=1 Tax=Brenneria alni TaxID=71656 RepID=UPI0014763B3B|nr:hypothetical protein [Brenneria alni]
MSPTEPVERNMWDKLAQGYPLSGSIPVAAFIPNLVLTIMMNVYRWPVGIRIAPERAA